LEGVGVATAAPDLVAVGVATAAPDLVAVGVATAAPDFEGLGDTNDLETVGDAAPDLVAVGDAAGADLEGVGVAAATGDAENVGLEHSNLITRLDTPTSVTSTKRPGKSGA